MKGKSPKFSDALKQWQSIGGYVDDDAAKDAFAKEFKQGICKGLENVSNSLFCKNMNMPDEGLALCFRKILH